MSAAASPPHPTLWRTFLLTLPDLLRSQPWLSGGLLLMGAVQGVMPAVTILIGQWTVDGLGRLLTGGSANLTGLAAAWAGAALLTQITTVLTQVLQGAAADHYTLQVNQRLMARMQTLEGLDVLEDPQFHDDIEVLQAGASHRPLNLASSIVYGLRGVVAAASVAATLLVIGWWVPLVVVAGLMPLLSQQMKFYRLGWSLYIQGTPQAREINYLARVALRHEYAKEVRLYGLAAELQARSHRLTRDYLQVLRAQRTRGLLALLPYEVLSLAVTAGLFIFVVAQAQQGQVGAGSVVLVITALAALRSELSGLSETLSTTSQHLSWFAKLHAFLQAPGGVQSPAQPRPQPRSGTLRLENVTFAYRGQPPVLHGLNLVIPEGQIVAIVGENGAGKTTLIKLLLRYYDPTGGRIVVGEGPGAADLRELDLPTWRAGIAAVFQDFARFEWSLQDNILLGQPLNEAKLSAAVQGSGLGAVLDRVGPLDTQLGQAFGGVDLSGGQWQKLATARALYRGARLLILDEPTAALDPRSEAEVFATFASVPAPGAGGDSLKRGGPGPEPQVRLRVFSTRAARQAQRQNLG
ncbi:ATP-binding cassette domain-containing protein [Deinococcus multiflagellatus]|uniref:ATP-binding cassette domain-containing protein n=1 Tax=Deinococcus multiflagellatus TaxID=1656887 RepID=UPI001CCAD61F|nr:ABC transporter ATP-binding protein [Deinococcus multiflagellatus]MBZ9714343.1 ABC transporter ATP-binding protein/permease [Deinococcus multiflagellatus]